MTDKIDIAIQKLDEAQVICKQLMEFFERVEAAQKHLEELAASLTLEQLESLHVDISKRAWSMRTGSVDIGPEAKRTFDNYMSGLAGGPATAN